VSDTIIGKRDNDGLLTIDYKGFGEDRDWLTL
jgi:hypothetical protein